MNKLIFLLLLSSFSIVHAAKVEQDNCYRDELKAFKKSAESELIFDQEANPGLTHIQRTIKVNKNLNSWQRLARFMFLALDPVLVTAENMPQLYSYVTELCKRANIPVPTIFITNDKHGFFNAAAAKLFATTGAIIIGQKMIYKTSQVELEAIIAHEIGHIKYNHVNKILLLKLVTLLGTKMLTDLARNLYNNNDKNEGLRNAKSKGSLSDWIPAFLAYTFLPSLIINKRFEKQADQFAFENDRAEGLIEFFEDLIKRENKHDKDFDTVYQNLENSKSQLEYADYIALKLSYYLAKGGHKISKLIHYLYHHTPLGAHPSPEDRIQAAQDYLAKKSDWNMAP